MKQLPIDIEQELPQELADATPAMQQYL